MHPHSIPFRSTPLRLIAFHSTPHYSTPLHSTPLYSTPLDGITLHSTPLHSTPLHSTHSTPLYSTPLHSTPLHTPLHSTPLHSIPLDSIPPTQFHFAPLFHQVGGQGLKLSSVRVITLPSGGTAAPLNGALYYVSAPGFVGALCCLRFLSTSPLSSISFALSILSNRTQYTVHSVLITQAHSLL
jgi:hypothetical protein